LTRHHWSGIIDATPFMKSALRTGAPNFGLVVLFQILAVGAAEAYRTGIVAPPKAGLYVD